MQLADEESATTLAVPALGAGIFAWAPADAAHHIVGAIVEWFAALPRDSTIRSVVLCDTSAECASAFDRAVRAAGSLAQEHELGHLTEHRAPTSLWEWQNLEQGSWAAYNYDVNLRLEDWYAAGAVGRLRLIAAVDPSRPGPAVSAGSVVPTYEVVREHDGTFSQLNSASAFKRRVRRTTLTPGQEHMVPLYPSRSLRSPAARSHAVVQIVQSAAS